MPDTITGEELLKRLQAQDEKLERIFRSVEKTRKYFLWTLIIGAVTIIVPLIGLAFILPTFLQSLAPGLL